MPRSKKRMPAWNAGLVPRTVHPTLYLSRQAWAAPLLSLIRLLAEMEHVVALLKHKAILAQPKTMVVVKNRIIRSYLSYPVMSSWISFLGIAPKICKYLHRFYVIYPTISHIFLLRVLLILHFNRYNYLILLYCTATNWFSTIFAYLF